MSWFLSEENNRRDIVYDIYSGGGDDLCVVQLRQNGLGLYPDDSERDGVRAADHLLLPLLQLHHGKGADREEDLPHLPAAGAGADLRGQRGVSGDGAVQDRTVRSLPLRGLLPRAASHHPARAGHKVNILSKLKSFSLLLLSTVISRCNNCRSTESLPFPLIGNSVIFTSLWSVYGVIIEV